MYTAKQDQRPVIESDVKQSVEHNVGGNFRLRNLVRAQIVGIWKMSLPGPIYVRKPNSCHRV